MAIRTLILGVRYMYGYEFNDHFNFDAVYTQTS